MSEKVTERELVDAFRTAKLRAADLKEQSTKANKELDKASSALVEHLDDIGAGKTSSYDGLGYVSIEKPRLLASCLKEDQGKLFDYLREVGREDMIKATVNPNSLSSFCSEKMGEGEALPEFVKMYFKPILKLRD